MAVAEGSFKVCGLCSQLVDEGVKLPDNLLEFLVTFLVVPGTKLPTKICTECYQGALESRKFKEKCLKTIDKLAKTQISSNMILGRSVEDIKTMKNKYKASPSPSVEVISSSPEVKVEPVKQERGRRSSLGEAINNSIENTFRTPTRRSSRTSSDHSGTGSDDLPLSTRQSLRKRALKQAVGSESKKYPQVVLSPKDRRAADSALGKTTTLNKFRTSKRKIRSPAKFDPMPEVSKKPRVEPPTPPPKVRKDPVPEPDPEVIEVDDDEEIFPSVGPYQCEICQQITETKQQFVEHIKSLHKDMVDEHVLRSLETDLKKRKKKELEQKKKNNTSKQKSQPAPAPAPAPDTPVKSSRSSKPKPRPRPKYSVDDDDDYRPGGKKKKGKSQTTPVKSVNPPALPKDQLMEPGTCDICGAVLSRAKDLPKHRESLKCRQAAFRQSNQMQQAQTDPLADVEMIQSAADPSKEPPSAKGPSSSKESPAVESTPVPGTGSLEAADQNEISINEGEASNTKLNGLDAKFKANIAKRYEAERGSGEERFLDPFLDEDLIPERSDIEETELAIKKAMKESIETAKKELGGDPLESSPIPPPSLGEKQLQYEPSTDKETAAVQPGEQGENGDHSPAAYIDPTPQPDVEPQKTSVIQTVHKNVSPPPPGAVTMSKVCDKPWTDGKSQAASQPTTLDLSALESAAGPPTSAVATAAANSCLESTNSLDTLESQMAALHGAAGANNPWQSFQPSYYDHQQP